VGRWVAAISLLVLAATVLLWQVYGPSPVPAGAAATPAASPSPALHAPAGFARLRRKEALRQPQARSPTIAPAETPEATRLDPRSDEFNQWVDVQLPRQLYDEAAQCYARVGGLRGGRGLARNQKLKLGYRIRIVDGEVTLAVVRVLDSTLGDGNLERCMTQAVAAARFRDPALPDWTGEDELLLRLRGMKKHLGSDPDEGMPPLHASAPAQPE
jgi:hypothetical protein